MRSRPTGSRQKPSARWSIRLSLTLLVAATLAPSLLFSFVLFDRYTASERALNSNAAETAAARTADAIDRELAGILATLNALATSPALMSGDLVAFVPQARAVGDRRGRVLVLSDAHGRELFRSVGMVRGRRREAVSAMPTVSGLLLDEGAWFVDVSVPVLREGQPVFLLSLELQAPVLAEVLTSQRLPSDWTTSMVDARDLIISRTAEAAGFVGREATADLRAHAVADEGAWTGTTLDGTVVLGGYARARLADWRVAVGAPLAAVERPLRRARLILGGGGLLLLASSIVLASWLAQQIARPLNRLAAAGQALSRGERLANVQARIREVAFAAQAMAEASDALHARSALLDAERARLAAIIETVPVGLLIVSPALDVMSGNAQMAEIAGRSAGLLPVSFDLRMADASAIPVEAMPITRALRGEVHPELECRLVRPDGSSVWVYMIAAPVLDASGAVTAAVVVALDIGDVVRAREETARSAELLEVLVAERTRQLEDANHRLRDEIASRAEAEAQLRQAQKMEAVGRLTGGIAHDFNNLLTIVIGSLDLLRRRTADARLTRLADNAMDGAQRAATLTARLLAFSRQQPLAPRTLDLNQLIDGMSDLIERTLGEPVQLEARLGPGLWPVYADPNQLENALINLAVNARDAIVEAGQAESAAGWLRLETANTHLNADVDVPDGDYVRLSVCDTGAGMPDDVIARAFEPFFTTKPIGQGTGLGLSQVHGFVKQSGGHVEIASRTAGDDRGTTVTIYLPRQSGALEAEPPSARAELPRQASGTILLVEDEGAVRQFAGEALRELGYTVVECAGIHDALAQIDAHPDVALLFTDMVLPEANGRVLADEARRRRPGLRVLFTTGYASGDLLTSQADGVQLINKPYTVAELATRIAHVLRSA